MIVLISLFGMAIGPAFVFRGRVSGFTKPETLPRYVWPLKSVTIMAPPSRSLMTLSQSRGFLSLPKETPVARGNSKA